MIKTNIYFPVLLQVVEDGYEFFAKRQLVTLFSAPNYCGEFDNAGGMMSVDESLMCSFQILKPSEKKAKYQYGGVNSGRPITPPRTAQAPKKRWAAGPDSPAPPPSWSLALVPPAGCLKHSSLLSVSLFVCKQKFQECFFACLWVFLWTCEWYFLIFMTPWYVLLSPPFYQSVPFSNIETNLLWKGQDVQKRCFPAFRLTISMVILWMHARLWD